MNSEQLISLARKKWPEATRIVVDCGWSRVNGTEHGLLIRIPERHPIGFSAETFAELYQRVTDA